MIYSKSLRLFLPVCVLINVMLTGLCLFNIPLRRAQCDLSNLIYLRYNINFKSAMRKTGRVTGGTATSLTVDSFCLP